MKRSFLFTSESVSEGHPDKVADAISDAILDAYLSKDPYSKVACETLITNQTVVVAGETHSTVNLHEQVDPIVRKVITDIGYGDPGSGFYTAQCHIHNLMHEQAGEIRAGVDLGGAGDQGLMFGYACNETESLMPLPIYLSHRLMERQAFLRKQGSLPWLLPDAKSQVTVRYEGDKPAGIETIVVSTQHRKGISQEMIREAVIRELILPVLPLQFRNDRIDYLINRSGSFEEGGPNTDTGLTGRKIIVDTYGGSCPHGGGAFSGKDSTKVDRSGAYISRYIAKNIVAAGLADRCTVQVSYVIAKPEPTSFMLDFHGTGRIPETLAEQAILKEVGLKPQDIITRLDLRRPIFSKTVAYGHFGRELPEFSWEKTDLVPFLQKL